MSTAIRDVHELFLPRSADDPREDASPELVRWSEDRLGVRLPRDYIDVLRTRPGSRLRLGGILLDRKPPRKLGVDQFYSFDQIHGLHRTNWNCLPDTAATAHSEWDVPKLLIPFDGDGHWWLCFDYRAAGPDAEPSITYYDTEIGGEFKVAESFAELLRRLICPDRDFQFEIADRSLRGDALDAFLRGIGCRPGRHKHRDTWDFPPYGGVYGDAAYLTASERFSRSPAPRKGGQPLPGIVGLTVDVSAKDQHDCIRKLAGAFGDRARLTYQPPDRSPVSLDRLPVVVVKPVKRRKPGQFSPADAWNAVWNGQVASVQDMLKHGLKVDRGSPRGSLSPLELAASQGHTTMLRILLPHAKFPITGMALHLALMHGHLAAAKLLLSAGVTLKPKLLAGEALAGRPAAVKLLLAAGLSPTPSLLRQLRNRSFESDSPAELAKMKRDYRAVIRLLDIPGEHPTTLQKPHRARTK